MDMSLSKLQKMVKDMEAWHTAVHVVAELDMTDQLNKNWFPALKFSFCWQQSKSTNFSSSNEDFYDPTLSTRFIWHML